MRKRRHVIGYLFGLALTLAGLTSAAIAQTTAPKGNGKITFTDGGGEHSSISVMNPDGSGRLQLTFTQIMCPPPNRPPGYGCGPDQLDYSPAWSPDGKQIAFVRSVSAPNFRYDSDVFVMNADGSDQRRLTLLLNVHIVSHPAWSPDGSKLAFVGPHTGDYYSQVYVMNTNGSGLRPVGRGVDPAWSPDGSKLAFSYGSLHLMNPDGSGRTQITAPKNPSLHLVDYDWAPAWSPDGARIIFNRSVGCDLDDACQSITIWTVNADGSNPAKLADIEAYGRFAWSPDGTKIVFSANGDLFTMEADGGNVTRITNTPDKGEWLPSWQPVASAEPLGINPIYDPQFFVRQHYRDFLAREPEPAGLQGWLAVLNNCSAGDARCDRIEVSSAFFRSPEFQERGYFTYRFYSTLGRVPHYTEFMPDLAKVSGFLTPEQLEANKAAFVSEFMSRQEFQSKYSSLNDPSAYVDSLLQNVGLPNHPTRNVWINGLTNGQMSRAQVLRGLVESAELYSKFYNEAFVVMQYFGYLRRDPDILYLEWIRIMNENGGDYRVMINGFVNSIEYRQRFGP